LAGVVEKVNMNYPHVWVWLIVTDNKGKSVTWALENTDPSSLRVQGWAPGSVKKGDSMTVAVNPLRDGRPIASVKAALLPGGKTVKGGGTVRCPLPWLEAAK
jgi:hypothetical protein